MKQYERAIFSNIASISNEMSNETPAIKDNPKNSVTFDTNMLTPSQLAILGHINYERRLAQALGIQIGQSESRENKMTYQLTSQDKRSIVQTAEHTYKNFFEDDNIKGAKPLPTDLYNIAENATIIEVEKMDAWISGSDDKQGEIEILVRNYIDGILTDWFDIIPDMFGD